MENKTCTKCLESKPATNQYFFREHRRSRYCEYRPVCKVCVAAERREKVDATRPLKTCSKCGEIRSTREFFKSVRHPDGFNPWCRECHRVATNARYAALNPEVKNFRGWFHGLKHKYGLTPADYARMLEEQGGVCAICGGEPQTNGKARFNVDHCHATGRVRSLLCFPCNSGIGRFKDDPELLRKAIAYLERHAVTPEQR